MFSGLFVLLFVLVTMTTFALWLRPNLFFGSGALPEWYGIVSGAAAAVFFITCFGVGVLISIARIRGAVWLP
jgi:hypothetical protein